MPFETREQNTPEFDARIAHIHGLSEGGRVNPVQSQDVRAAEFCASVETFLGKDFDAIKIAKVEGLQLALHAAQARLLESLECELIDPEVYVDEVNAVLRTTFAQCEEILGAEGFVKLFGGAPSEMGGFIDKDVFMEEQNKLSKDTLEIWLDDRLDDSGSESSLNGLLEKVSSDLESLLRRMSKLQFRRDRLRARLKKIVSPAKKKSSIEG